MTEMVETRVNGAWSLLLPEYRAARAEWATGWEVARLESMHALLAPGDVVYDLGTEEGDLSALVASWVGPECVVLVEPNAAVWPTIRAIFEANGLVPRGWVHGFAAERDLTASGPVYGGPSTWPEAASRAQIAEHGYAHLAEDPDGHRVRVDTMVDWFGPPTALTIDVDGSELVALRGAIETLHEHRPLVWCSVHPDYMMHAHGHYEHELHRYMAALGYQGQHLAYDHEHHWLWVATERVEEVRGCP